MRKQSCFFIFIIVFAITAYAETCPTINNIHQHTLSGWQVFDIDNGTPLSTARFEQYTQSVQQFALAEWMEDAPEGSGHCYYYGKNPDQRYLNAYLAKQNLIPEQNTPAWKSVDKFTMHCRTGVNACRFVEK